MGVINVSGMIEGEGFGYILKGNLSQMKAPPGVKFMPFTSSHPSQFRSYWRKVCGRAL
jgi:hypothetical protein